MGRGIEAAGSPAAKAPKGRGLPCAGKQEAGVAAEQGWGRGEVPSVLDTCTDLLNCPFRDCPCQAFLAEWFKVMVKTV